MGRPSTWSRVLLGGGLLAALIVAGTAGYLLFGFSLGDAAYQTVITVTTVGFKEVRELSGAERAFTMVLALAGPLATLVTFGAVLQTLFEGSLRDLYGRRRMQQQIAEISDHVIVCGWGRVGRALAEMVATSGRVRVVVVESDPARAVRAPGPVVIGDATEDEVLVRAGVARARALVAAVDTDAANLLVTLSARALNPNLFIAARARMESNEEKLRRAGADRVVNPQAIGGARLAAFVLQPNVAEFLDVVMHDGSLEFRLEEVVVSPGSQLAGRSLDEVQIRRSTGALILAVRNEGGEFVTNPPADLSLRPGQVLIAIGTAGQLAALEAAAAA